MVVATVPGEMPPEVVADRAAPVALGTVLMGKTAPVVNTALVATAETAVDLQMALLA